jgi:hypothetical protein
MKTLDGLAPRSRVLTAAARSARAAGHQLVVGGRARAVQELSEGAADERLAARARRRGARSRLASSYPPVCADPRSSAGGARAAPETRSARPADLRIVGNGPSFARF